MNQLWGVSFPYWQFIIRAAVVYAFVLILLRLAGKRQIGQMGTGEFVAILLISNAVQNSMNGGDNSITGGLVLSTVIVALSELVDYLTYKSRKMQNLLEGTPTLLIHNGRVIHKNLERELLNVYELRTMLRRQGIHNIAEVWEAILESNGSLSVTKRAEVEHGENGNSA